MELNSFKTIIFNRHKYMRLYKNCHHSSSMLSFRNVNLRSYGCQKSAEAVPPPVIHNLHWNQLLLKLLLQALPSSLVGWLMLISGLSGPSSLTRIFSPPFSFLQKGSLTKISPNLVQAASQLFSIDLRLTELSLKRSKFL